MGTSWLFACRSVRCRDHPHACGDKPLILLFSRAYVRIIPTRVGTSSPNSPGSSCPQDHPHACGDKLLLSKPPSGMPGSSPRVWGQERYSQVTVLTNRIIPTRVGTSTQFLHNLNWARDHPHACGDKLSISSRICATLGSSPRVWGQGPQLSAARQAARIIPTRVGTSTKLYQT